MSTTDRVDAERVFHDRQARDRSGTFSLHPDKLQVDDVAYLGHETWIRPAVEQLGDVHGMQVLDYGCGHGMMAVVLARRGARVTAFDLSPGYLEEAVIRAQANGVGINFVQADAERLPFGNGSFHRVWGNAVLHHLDVAAAARELHRILRPGGMAVFCEPWGENPLLSWARRRLPYPEKERTVDEKPLRRRHLQLLNKTFPIVEVRGFQLLSMARRVFGEGRFVAGLEWCDHLLLRRVPELQRFCRYVVLTLKRDRS